MKYTTLFLDRDGTLIQKPPEGDYIKSISEVNFLPGVLEAMPILDQAFERIIVVTNQRGVAKGVLSIQTLTQIHNYIHSQVWGAIDRFYFCPHELDSCDCRKPLPGLAFKAQLDFPEIKFSDSTMAGDALTDMQFGMTIGALPILISPRYNLLDFAKQIRTVS